MKKYLIFLLLLLTCFLSGCFLEVNEGSDFKFIFQEHGDVVSIYLGDYFLPNVKITLNGQTVERDITLESYNPDIAYIYEDKIYAMALGTTDICISLKDRPEIKTYMEINVTERMFLKVRNNEIHIGETLLISYEDYKYPDKEDLELTSSDPSILEVNGESVKGLKVGEARIILTSRIDGKTKSISIKVIESSSQSLKIPNIAYTLEMGKLINLGAYIVPTYIDQNLIYTSSDESVATIDDEGNILGISRGRTTITVTSKYNPSLSKSFTLKVVGPIITNYYPSGYPNEVYVGDEFQVSVYVYPTEGKDNLTFVSSNPDVATVDNNGYVKVLKKGEFIITCNFESKHTYHYSKRYIVHETNTNLKIKDIPTEIYSNQSYPIEARVYPFDLPHDVIWESSDSSIAEVINGNLVVYKKGNFSITATSIYDQNLTVTVNLTSYDYVSSYININIAEFVEVGGSFKIYFTRNGNDAIDELTLLSYDPSIISVDEKGNCKGLAIGETYITLISKNEPKFWVFHILVV